MTFIPDKDWWKSMTFWGALMLVVSMAVGNLFNIDIGDPNALAQQIVDFLDKVMGLLGTFLSIIGVRRSVVTART